MFPKECNTESLFVFLVFITAPITVSGATLTVPGQYSTISSAISAASAGDVIEVSPGDYSESISISKSGSASQLITIKSSQRRQAEVNSFSISGNYIRVEGFTIQGGSTGILISGNNNEVVDNHLDEITNKAITTSGTGNYIGYNYITYPQWGIYISGQDAIVENNEVLGLVSYSGRDCDYSRFFGSGHIIRSNYFHGMNRAQTGSAHPDCLQTFEDGGSPSVNNIVIEKNICFDFSQGIMAEADARGDSSDVYVRNNIFAHGTSGVILRDQYANVYTEHNTIADVSNYGVWYRSRESNDGNTNGDASNNIIYNGGSGITIEDSHYIEVNNNLLYNSNLRVSCSDGTCTQSGNIQGQDPQFSDYSNNDFTPLDGSPACGAAEDGTDIGALPCGISSCIAMGHVCAAGCNNPVPLSGCGTGQTCCMENPNGGSSTCGDGTCDAGETCADDSCCNGISYTSSQVCCSGSIFTGNCCMDIDCQGQSCIDHVCTTITCQELTGACCPADQACDGTPYLGLSDCPTTCCVGECVIGSLYFHPDEIIEAEEGDLTDPMTITTGSGETYVHTPINTQGSVSFIFEITALGTYTMDSRILPQSPTPDGHNSLYVGLDNEQASGNNAFTWDTELVTAFTWEEVSLRGSSDYSQPPQYDPKTWGLTPGLHTCTSYGREIGLQIDKITLKSSSGVTHPADLDEDGCVDINELNTYITRYKGNQGPQLMQVMGAISIWLNC